MLDRIQLVGRRFLSIVGHGAEAPLRIGREGALIVGKGQGDLQEAAERGRLFYASVGVAGVDPGTAIDTSAPFALANPTASRVNLVIRRLSIGYVSGTIGAGFVAACFGPEHLTAVSGTALTPVGFGGASNSQGKPLSSATLPASPTLIGAVFSLGAQAATTALAPSVSEVDVHGGIVIPPRCSFSLQAVCAAGTTPLVVLGAAWEEVPLD